jgi:dynein assembly factor 1
MKNEQLRTRHTLVEMPRDEDGTPQLTEEYIQALCEENCGYATPYLNDTLHLHFKGFKKIQCLERYINLKSIWLESNGLSKIEGLESQTKMRSIMLRQNSINTIENISHMSHLCKLDISGNRIVKIEGLKGLDNLATLDLSLNYIASTTDCEELLELPALVTLDLKENKIADG